MFCFRLAVAHSLSLVGLDKLQKGWTVPNYDVMAELEMQERRYQGCCHILIHSIHTKQPFHKNVDNFSFVRG